jgi:hypothetical protein
MPLSPAFTQGGKLCGHRRRAARPEHPPLVEYGKSRFRDRNQSLTVFCCFGRLS